jgi:outer membrane protein OmpA-like peptidoglycan-associated protein
LSKVSRLSSRKNFRVTVALVAASGFAFAGPAFAQDLPDSSGTIQLHMPGEAIHLHMPKAHRAAAKRKPKQAATETVAPQSTEAAPIPFGAEVPAAPQPKTPTRRVAASPRPQAVSPRPQVASVPARTRPLPAGPVSRAERRKAVQEVLAAPANATPESDTATDVSTPAAVPFSFDSSAPAAAPVRKPAARPAPVAPKTKASSVVRDKSQLASLEPAPKEVTKPLAPKADSHAGLTKQGEVLFAGGGTDPEAQSAGQLKSLAGSLNAALDAGAAGVELEAYGGAPGDKSSDARRLSLRRALAIRQLLIDSGVPADRIDVRALGGIVDRGNADRVDVFLRGAS